MVGMPPTDDMPEPLIVTKVGGLFTSMVEGAAVKRKMGITVQFKAESSPGLMMLTHVLWPPQYWEPGEEDWLFNQSGFVSARNVGQALIRLLLSLPFTNWRRAARFFCAPLFPFLELLFVHPLKELFVGKLKSCNLELIHRGSVDPIV